MQGIREEKCNGSRKAPKLAEIPNFDAKLVLSSVESGRFTERCQRKKVVFQQGDPADAVFYVQSGRIELTVESEQGKQGVVGLLTVGDFLGEGCLWGQPLHMGCPVPDTALLGRT